MQKIMDNPTARSRGHEWCKHSDQPLGIDVELPRRIVKPSLAPRQHEGIEAPRLAVLVDGAVRTSRIKRGVLKRQVLRLFPLPCGCQATTFARLLQRIGMCSPAGMCHGLPGSHRTTLAEPTIRLRKDANDPAKCSVQFVLDLDGQRDLTGRVVDESKQGRSKVLSWSSSRSA